MSRAIDLLVLDFAGVCTPASSTVLEPIDPSGQIHIRPEIAKLVVEARGQGILVAILSNEISTAWNIEFFEEVDYVINCADNRIFKPDRRAFQRCNLLTGTSPERTVVVDDNLDNVAVAASLGMATVLYDVDDVANSTRLISEAIA